MSHRILFVSYAADWSGPNNSLLLLLEHLRHRYEIAVLLPGEGQFFEILSQKEIPYFRFPSLDKWAIPSIVRLIQREKFDLVYGNGRNGISRNALIAAKLSGRPFICHVREMEWGDSWQINGFLHWADRVITVSQACAAANSKFVPKDRLNVVYNGIDLTTAQQASQDLARTRLISEIGLAMDNVILINVGRIIPAKGQEYVIEAMAKVVNVLPHARLLIVGSFDQSAEEKIYADKIRLLIQSLGLEQHVFLLGFRQDVPQLMAGADLLLYGSLSDAHPRTVIEAMAAGLPVVAFSVDGVAETVVDGQTGYLISPKNAPGMADAVLKIMTKPDLYRQMSAAGQQRAKTHFSAGVTAQQVSAIIDSVLAKANTSSR